MFNDYMNCLRGNPTTEREMPLIDAAARAGSDYYIIDCGWYAEMDETWWDAVGAWEPSKSRFPAGLERLMDEIRGKGMIPGIWVEPEVVGIRSPLKDKPDDWFLMRNGKRIIDNARYLLDFRNPAVRRHMASVVERLVRNYRVGYFKFDYNNLTWGTDVGACSAGQGLLEHNRAVVAWYKEIRDSHPSVVIENCGSGGCRMDYAMLAQAQIQSSSDQEDYRKYPAVLVGAMAAVLPEQLAIWSYPLAKGGAREASFNMVNAMAGRIHLSGQLSDLPKDAFQQVEAGIHVYKTLLAPVIFNSTPFFPLGMPSLADERSPVALGLRSGSKEFLFVWRLAGEADVTIPIAGVKQIQLLYPASQEIVAKATQDAVQVSFPAPHMAAIVELQPTLETSMQNKLGGSTAGLDQPIRFK